MESATRRQVLGSALAGGVVLATALTLSPATLLARVEMLSSDPLLFGGVLTLVYLGRPFLLWPISAVSVLVGYVLGLELGLVVSLAGAVGTSLVPFGIARYTRTTGGLFGSLGEHGDRLVETTGALRGVVAARLAPLPADAVAYATGLSGVSLPTMLLGTAIGELPWVVAAVLAGSSMRTLSVQGLGTGLPLLVGTTSLAVLVVAGPVYRHLRGHGEPA